MPTCGSTLGIYTVERELGRGGMGVVFLARDTRLDRLVALKALPEDLSDDQERLGRFEREARLLASLNHSGIGAIYGMEVAEGRRYLVLEYVDGTTLEERLASGPMGIEEALPIARQIAEALEVAHEKGIVHRDLKPGNVMLRGDGAVKVLDFGLARSAPPRSGISAGSGSSSLPTMTSAPLGQSPTMPGAILGTPGYMSPEQARGRPIDARADIFALGCVLFEMLTGRRAFPGDSQADSIAAVIEREPGWQGLPARTPLQLRELLEKCLEKEVRRRIRDAGDVRLELERCIERRAWMSSTLAPRAGAPAARRLPAALGWIVAGVAVVAGVLAWRLGGVQAPSPADSAPAPAGTVRFSISSDGYRGALVDTRGTLAISRDGRAIVFTGEGPDHGLGMLVRTLNDPMPRPIPNGANWVSGDPMLSPDGRSVAYFGSTDLYSVPIDGGVPVLVYRGPGMAKGAVWTASGILCSPTPSSGLVMIPLDGGTPKVVTTPDASAGEVSHRWPDALPGGTHFLFTIKKSDMLTFDDADIGLLDATTGKWKQIIHGGSYARYAPPGHIVYATNGRLLAVSFDLQALAVTSSAVEVVPGIITDPGSGSAGFAIAPEAGMLVYQAGGRNEPAHQAVWVDAKGTITPTKLPNRNYASLAISPDGTRVACTVFGACDAIFVYDFAAGTSSRLTFRGNCSSAAWTPDGAGLVFSSDAEGPQNTYLAPADGSAEPRKLFDGILTGGCSIARLPSGELVVVYESGGDIFMRSGDRPGPPTRLVGSQFFEGRASVSRDGKWLAYVSEESGQAEVYVRPFPSGEGKVQVSRGGGGGVASFWAADGKSLIYMRAHVPVRVTYRADTQFRVDDQAELGAAPEDFRAPSFAPDGSRSLWVKPVATPYAGDRVYAVVGWSQELKAKLPGG